MTSFESLKTPPPPKITVIKLSSIVELSLYLYKSDINIGLDSRRLLSIPIKLFLLHGDRESRIGPFLSIIIDNTCHNRKESILSISKQKRFVSSSFLSGNTELY